MSTPKMKMTKPFVLKAGLFVLSLAMTATVTLAASPARAQSCDVIGEAITTLTPPQLGFPSVWDVTYSQDRRNMTQFFSSVALDDGNVLTFGRTLSAENYHPLKTFLSVLNRRGRTIDEKTFPAAPGEKPVKILRHKNGFVTLSSITDDKGDKKRQARLVWYNEKLTPQGSLIISNPAYDYVAQNMETALDGDGVLVALQEISRDYPDEKHGFLVRVNDARTIVWKRAYRPGIPNMIASATKTDRNSYLAAGQIEMGNKHKGGWALELNEEGAILWQQTYPRGTEAALHTGSSFVMPAEHQKGFLLTGTSKPLDDGPQAGWIMAIDYTGTPLWQRYYRRDDYSFTPIGLRTTPDGRSFLGLDAAITDPKTGHNATYRGHIRLLTLSPRGDLMRDESYIEGRQVMSTEMSLGPRDSHLVTSTLETDPMPIGLGDGIEDIPDTPDTPRQIHRDKTLKGWVLLIPPPAPYKDPCLDKPQWP